MPSHITNGNVRRIFREIIDSLVFHRIEFLILAEFFRDYVTECFNEGFCRISHIFHATPAPTHSPLAQSV